MNTWEAVAIDKSSGQILEIVQRRNFTEICIYAMMHETEDIEIRVKEIA